MIEQCLTNYDIDLSNSYFIGDSENDIKLGSSIGCSTIAVRGYSGKTHPNYKVDTLLEAVKLIKI